MDNKFCFLFQKSISLIFKFIVRYIMCSLNSMDKNKREHCLVYICVVKEMEKIDFKVNAWIMWKRTSISWKNTICEVI